VPKFTPLPESAFKRPSFVLPRGEYDFEVYKAENKTFGSGASGIALTLMVFRDDGSHRLVDENLVFSEAALFKVSDFAKCVGIYAKYEAGEIDAAHCQGKSGRCFIVIQPPKDSYKEKNKVSRFIVPTATQSPDSIAKEQESNPDWDITP
jgi:hypothetical protein